MSHYDEIFIAGVVRKSNFILKEHNKIFVKMQ